VTIVLQLIYVWIHDCPLSSSVEFCQCLVLLEYDNYDVIYPVAVLVYTGIAVMYSITCRQIYFCREMHRNTCQFRQVLVTNILYAPRNVGTNIRLSYLLQ